MLVRLLRLGEIPLPIEPAGDSLKTRACSLAQHLLHVISFYEFDLLLNHLALQIFNICNVAGHFLYLIADRVEGITDLLLRVLTLLGLLIAIVRLLSVHSSNTSL